MLLTSGRFKGLSRGYLLKLLYNALARPCQKKKKTNYLLLSCEDVKQVSSANTNIIFWLWRWLPHRSSKRQSLESLSKGVFERRTSTGSEAFSLLTCLDDIKFVFLSFFTVIEAIWLKIWAKTPSKDEKRPLPVDFAWAPYCTSITLGRSNSTYFW